MDADVDYLLDLLAISAAVSGVAVAVLRFYAVYRSDADVRGKLVRAYGPVLSLTVAASALILYGFLRTRTEVALPDVGGAASSLPLPALAGLVALCLGQLHRVERARCRRS